MKNISHCLRLVAFLVLLFGHGLTARAALVNLAASATGGGLLPVVPLFQGVPAGAWDGSMYQWFGGGSSPRSSGVSNLQPYMTWSANQTIRTVRIWADTISTPSYDRLRIDTLVSGGDPTQEASWTNRYDSGTGLAATFVDVNLGATYTTSGLRLRADRIGNDISVGEVAVFAPLPSGGTLTAKRVAPTGEAASSSAYTTPAGGDNVNWFDRWLSDTPANNSGTDYTYDELFNSASFNVVSVTWGAQGGFSDIPTSWELLANTGAGLNSLGTFTPTLAQNGETRHQYYIDLGTMLTNVTDLRLRVPEANVTNGVAVFEMEAINMGLVPEPATLGLLAAGALLLCRRRG